MVNEESVGGVSMNLFTSIEMNSTWNSCLGSSAGKTILGTGLERR
jgi:hypothetical protein